MPNGYVYKRCGCRDPETRKPFGQSCPKLRRTTGNWSSDHGLWYYQIELPHRPGTARRILRAPDSPATPTVPPNSTTCALCCTWPAATPSGG